MDLLKELMIIYKRVNHRLQNGSPGFSTLKVFIMQIYELTCWLSVQNSRLKVHSKILSEKFTQKRPPKSLSEKLNL